MITIDNALRLAIAATIAFIFFQLGTIWTEQSGADPWMYRWQTILTGVMAIGAAGLTVMETRRTDMKQQARHDELYRLTLRPAHLAVQRAAHFKQYYTDLAKDVEMISGDIRARIAAEWLPPTSEEIQSMRALQDRFKLGVEMRAMKSAVDLFGPRMSAQFETLAVFAPKLLEKIEEIDRLRGANTSFGNRLASDRTIDFLDQIDWQHPTLLKFAQSLEDLCREYDSLQRSSSP